MKNVILKEMKLSASVLTYLFIGFGLMFFLPGYPVLCGAFFVTLGIFQSYQDAAKTNDIVYSALLPIAKRDVVKGKYLFACLVELGAFLLMAAATLVRMTALADAQVYRTNALMNANPFALGAALCVFGIFNGVFLRGFFKTAYQVGRPFVLYVVLGFLFIGIAEALHYVPGLEGLNAFAFERLGLQLAALGVGAGLFLLLTALSFRRACARFEKIDL